MTSRTDWTSGVTAIYLPSTDADRCVILVGRRPSRLLLAVEEPFDDAAGPAGDSPVLVAQPTGAGVERPGQVRQVVGALGQGVRSRRGRADQPPAVPGPLAEPVGGPQHGRVVGIEQRGLFETLEGTHCRRRSGGRAELEQLHGPLDVRQRPPAELEVKLRVLARRDPLALDAGLHAAHLALVVGGKRALPDRPL